MTAAARTTDNGMPVYRVIYTDGESYVTAMAHGVTPDQARAYFVGRDIEQLDEKTIKRVQDVQPEPQP